VSEDGNGTAHKRETDGGSDSPNFVPTDGAESAVSVPDDDEDTYVESQVIMSTVRVVAPFSLTYGLFLMFHGADTPGGSFQGGAIIGATVLMVAFAFGIEPTRAWLRNRTVVALAAGGTAVFVLVGLIPLLAGGRFLEHHFYVDIGLIDTPKWGLEAIEVGGVAPIVAGVVIGMFFLIAAGWPPEGETEVTGDE